MLQKVTFKQKTVICPSPYHTPVKRGSLYLEIKSTPSCKNDVAQMMFSEKSKTQKYKTHSFKFSLKDKALKMYL
jgi:hypothetical protein